MTVEVEAGGSTRRVDVRRHGEGWAVTVDGRKLDVIAVASNNRWSLLIRTADGGQSMGGPGSGPWRSYEIAVEARGGDGERVVHVGGLAVRTTVASSRTLFGRRGHVPSASSSPGRVVAPMPGRVVKVLVKPGDSVAPGQGLVVVEAMKMENELRAPGQGTVKEVHVTEGMSIDAKTVLVTLD